MNGENADEAFNNLMEKYNVDEILNDLRDDLINRLGENEYNKQMRKAREECCFMYPQIPFDKASVNEL